MNPVPPRYVVLEKPIGQTPLEAIAAWKAAHPEFANLPATYAGRLDPMASGTLLVLLGKECKRREKYLGLDKEYEVEVVLDLATDTGDALGLAAYDDAQSGVSAEDVRTALHTLTGTHTVPYPAFSSKTVNGKPLFMYALEGTLDNTAIPEHEETIYRILLLATTQISAEQLNARIRSTLRTVPRGDEPSKGIGADFRQDAVRAQWDKILGEEATDEHQMFTLIHLRVTCGSGTYMRTLAERLGRALETTAFALSIHRTKIGRYLPFGPFGFWRKNYT